MDIIKKKCSIVEIRTTNDKSFALYKYGERDYSTEFQMRAASMIDLYIVSDEEIKEGDWVIWGNYIQFTGKNGILNYKEIENDLIKIIASTDKYLNLPSIPKAFIKEYCKVGGIPEVMVDYINECQVCGAEQYYDYCHYPNATGCCGGKCNPIPLLNSKNEIILSIAKEAWTRKELPIDAMITLVKSFDTPILKRKFQGVIIESVEELNKWIKKNL